MIGLVGFALGGSAVAVAARRAINAMEVPPTELAKAKLSQAKAAAGRRSGRLAERSAGASGTRRLNPAAPAYAGRRQRQPPRPTRLVCGTDLPDTCPSGCLPFGSVPTRSGSRTATSIPSRLASLEQAQELAQAGPYVQAYRTRAIVAVPDLSLRALEWGAYCAAGAEAIVDLGLRI